MVWYSLPIIEPLQVVLLSSTLDCDKKGKEFFEFVGMGGGG